MRHGKPLALAFSSSLGAGARVTTIRCIMMIWGLAIALLPAAHANSAAPFIQPPELNTQHPIEISADRAHRWQERGYEVWHLRGGCRVEQDNMTAEGYEAIVWIDRASGRDQTISNALVYIEGQMRVDYAHNGVSHNVTRRPAQSIAGNSWFGRLQSSGPINVHAARVGGRPIAEPAIYARGRAANKANSVQPAVRPAQFTTPESIPTPPPAPSRTTPRRVLVLPRGTAPIQARSFTDPIRQEQITTIDWGVKISIDSGADDALEASSRIVILADRAVVWSSPLDQLNVSQESIQRGETPLEFYLEGNIVFAQGDRVIYAERMYYNVQGKYGTILNAEVLTPVPDYQGLLRLKADVVQQLDEENFEAFGAAVTSSRLGVPSYWFQAGNVKFRDVQSPIANPFTGQVLLDDRTGDPLVEHKLLATSRNNFVYVGGFPVFYWPILATNLKRPIYYINRVSVRNDEIFGFQARTNWDVHQLLGIRDPILDEWGLEVDTLDKRGLGLGTNLRFSGDDLLGLQGPYGGFLDAWGIQDKGVDNIGADRQALVPPRRTRGRILQRYRQDLDIGFTLIGEFGLISDKNFLDQYYEREWDMEKDQTTGLLLRRLAGVHSLNLSADVRINDFFTQTDSLPRLDHFMLGASPLNDWLTWYGHSYAGYHRLKTAGATPAPDPSLPLPWETTTAGVPYAQRDGIVAGTRQEIDLPLDAGWFKVVPYALGDVMFVNQDRDGNDVTRLYGQAGIRASLPIWKADSSVQSELWNLNGLAHKVTFDGDFNWSDANRNADRFPLYHPLDDDAQEAFRRRFFIPTGTLAGLAPALRPRSDERSYAIRSGMQSSVTAASPELAEDLVVAQLGIRQRWQTKNAFAGGEKVVDWIVFDVQGSLFPKSDRDNFGADLGQVQYDFRWNINNRFAVLSDGYFDEFAEGLRTASIGAQLAQPEHGDFYVGFRSIEGPITSSVVSASVSYRMSPKWIVAAGTSYDFSSVGNIGQTIEFTRVGESFLTRIGFVVDVGRRNATFALGIEPRFFPRTMGTIGGVQIPPAGARGVE